MKQAKSAYIDIIDIKGSSIHNRGIFATQDIPKDTNIIEYVGEKITKKESEKRYEKTLKNHKHGNSGAVYIFELNSKYDIDGNVPYNVARLMNHSCNPNCEAVNVNGKIWIRAMRTIKKGEELSYDYGYGIEDFHEHPCFCGAKKCQGYIVAQQYWPQLKRILQKRDVKIHAN